MRKIGKVQSELIKGNLVLNTTPERGGGWLAMYKDHPIYLGDMRNRRPFKVDGHAFSSFIRALRFVDKQEAMENGD